MATTQPSQRLEIYFSNEIKDLPTTMNKTHTDGITVAWSASASPLALQAWHINKLRADKHNNK